MDSHCAEDEQNNLVAHNEFLIKEHTEEYNSEYAGDAEVKGQKHHSCLQEQERKTCNVSAEETPPPVEDEKSKVGGEQMTEVPEVVDSAENIEAELGHKVFVDDCRNAVDAPRRRKRRNVVTGTCLRQPRKDPVRSRRPRGSRRRNRARRSRGAGTESRHPAKTRTRARTARI